MGKVHKRSQLKAMNEWGRASGTFRVGELGTIQIECFPCIPSVILPTAVSGKYYYSHFEDEEIDIQKG